MDLSLPTLLGFGLALLRTSALIGAAPVLGSKAILARLKLTLSLAVAFAAWTGAGAPAVPVPATMGGLIALVLSETALGLTAGLSSRLLLDAAQAGGQAAGMSIGFGFGQVLDPHSNAESTSIGEVYKNLALAAAIALGLHTEAIGWVARSLHEVPPGGTVEVTSLAAALVRQVVFGLVLAVRVAWPLFTASLFGYGVLGLLGRAAPQLSLSNVGFAVSLLSGGSALYLVAPDAAQLCAEAATRLFTRS